MAAILRPGRAGSNTAADHITVLDQALVQIPGEPSFSDQTEVRAPVGGRGAQGIGCGPVRDARGRVAADTGRKAICGMSGLAGVAGVAGVGDGLAVGGSSDAAGGRSRV